MSTLNNNIMQRTNNIQLSLENVFVNKAVRKDNFYSNFNSTNLAAAQTPSYIFITNPPSIFHATIAPLGYPSDSGWGLFRNKAD